MILTIDDNKKISALKQEFNALFPYLKLELFTKPNKTGELPSRKVLISDDKTFGQCGALKNGGGVDVEPEMLVSELELFFKQHYGLLVQVFRKSGKVWLETSLTDKWTLEQQNRYGKALTESDIF
jgi:hypothetical protein